MGIVDRVLNRLICKGLTVSTWKYQVPLVSKVKMLYHSKYHYVCICLLIWVGGLHCEVHGDGVSIIINKTTIGSNFKSVPKEEIGCLRK